MENFITVLLLANLFWVSLTLNVNYSSDTRSWFLHFLLTGYLFLTAVMLVIHFYKSELFSLDAATIPAIISLAILKLKFEPKTEFGFFIIGVMGDILLVVNVCLLMISYVVK